MLETLATTAEQVDMAEPISAHPDKLKDQLADNKAIMEDLDKRLAALQAVKDTADELLNQTGMDDENARGTNWTFVVYTLFFFLFFSFYISIIIYSHCSSRLNCTISKNVTLKC